MAKWAGLVLTIAVHGQVKRPVRIPIVEMIWKNKNRKASAVEISAGTMSFQDSLRKTVVALQVAQLACAYVREGQVLCPL